MAFENALALAQSRGGTVKRFRQPRGWCAGFVAIWLRCKARYKDFFEVQKGFSRKEYLKIPDISLDEFVLSSGDIDVAAHPKPDDKKDRRITKAATLMHQQQQDLDVYNRYIEIKAKLE